MRGPALNEHGVLGYWSHCGSMFGRDVVQSDGTKRFQTGLPLFVPDICRRCPHFDYGEYGDYGNLLSGPYCEANIWLPTRSGACKKGQREIDRNDLWAEARNLKRDLAVAVAHPSPRGVHPTLTGGLR